MTVHICKRCKDFFDRKSTYDYHVNRKNKCSLNKSGSKINTISFKYACKICDKKFSRKDALFRHRTTKSHKNKIKKTKIKINDNSNNNINRMTKGHHNKILNKAIDNSVTNNTTINNTTINNNNNYYISAFGNEEINKLTTRDKLAILLSNKDPIIQIIIKTNLNSSIPEYHNIGYIDLKSGYGYIFNGKSWEKKEIRLVMNDLINFKGRDLKKIHREVSKYMTNDDNKNVNNILQDIDNTIIPSNEHSSKIKKKLVANLKAQFFNKRNLIIEAIDKSGKPIISSNENENDLKINLKNGMTIEELDKILIENKLKAEKLAPRKEIAKYILSDHIKFYKTDKDQYQKINEIIDDILEDHEMNVITRLLCQLYCNKNSININTIKKKINTDNLASKLITKQ